MKKINPKHLAVLRRIQASIPKEWLDSLIKKGPMAPVVKEVYERGIADPDVSEALKEKMRLVLNSGILDKEVEISDSEIEAKIDSYVEEEMKKAVLRGELPKKLLKHGNKKQKSS